MFLTLKGRGQINIADIKQNTQTFKINEIESLKRSSSTIHTVTKNVEKTRHGRFPKYIENKGIHFHRFQLKTWYFS